MTQEEAVRKVREEAARIIADARSRPPDTGRKAENSATMKRWPRLCAHIICESLGYATPALAARIVMDAKALRQNWCEWVYSCYKGDPVPVVKDAIRSRHYHRGPMSEYLRGLAAVCKSLQGDEPLFASWF